MYGNKNIKNVENKFYNIDYDRSLSGGYVYGKE